MNKIAMGVAVAALCGASAFADEPAAIQSANVVGFTTQAVKGDTYYLLGTQFTEVSAEQAKAKFGDILKLNGIDAVSWKNRKTGPQILVNTAKGYDYYYYTTEAYDESIDDEVTGWADGGGDLADVELNLGEGFWFLTPADIPANASISFAGQVLNDSSKPAEFGVGFSIICNTLPCAVDFSKTTATGIDAVSWKNRKTGAQILVNTEKGYDYYYYTTEAYDESIDDEVTGWADGGGDLAKGDLINPGESFWMNSPTAGTLLFR